MSASKKQTFRGVDLVTLVGSSSIKIRWGPADIMAIEAHLARHRLHLGNYGTLYFFEILNLLLARDGLSNEADPEATLIISPKVKSSLQYRLKKLAKEGHVELARGLQNQHTARWEAYTSSWAKPGWDGCKQAPLQLPPTPPRDVDDEDDDELMPFPPVEDAEEVVAPLVQTLSSPPATPRLRPQQAASEPWLDVAGFGSQPTLEENLAAFEMPSPTAAALFGLPASPPPPLPPRVWQQQQQQQRQRRALPQTPPRSSAIVVVDNSPPAVVAATPVGPAIARAVTPASPLSDRYVAMVRAAEQRERARSPSPRPPPPPSPPPPPPSHQQQQQLLLRHEDEDEKPRVQQDDLTPPRTQNRARTQTRPRMVGAAPFTLFSDQAKIYIKMHRCALVVLLLTAGVAGSRMSEDKRKELVEEVRQRMRMLAVANAGIERRLAAISLVLASPKNGSTAIRNLYRVAGVEYAG
ncbi:hypothetical protein K4K49_005371 [Colletotrichum sp. SAR 10_70]|nr:hypothetical protein K4K50_009017 [Colletotrichum sp. SAR 10_71]KAI8166988.1 hypothetical protein K4K49_005371 [Colletotrichum sp. SAR 10_70]KAI8194023.1 hypothetical protein KHU50_012061 [Colletotrichum sp. SAR 10_65]KAI8251834.1 hypothetical protein K4K53_011821 [Colletotrichum sp. SAR 10_77]